MAYHGISIKARTLGQCQEAEGVVIVPVHATNGQDVLGPAILASTAVEIELNGFRTFKPKASKIE